MSALAPVQPVAARAVRRLAVRHLAIAVDAATAAIIADAAATFGWPAPEQSRGIAPAIHAIARGAPPALIIVDLDTEAEPLAALSRLADHCLAETRVIAIGSANDIDLFRALLAIGVADYLQKPLRPDALLAALHRVVANPDPVAADPSQSGGRVIAVLGVRGGCGATTIATSLAWAIADAGARAGTTTTPSPGNAILVDLDLHFGSAGLVFGLEPGPGLAAMLAASDRLDDRLIAAALQPVGPGLGLIAGATPLEQDDTVSPDAAAHLVAALRTTAPWVVADLPRRLDGPARQILRTADTVLLVAPPSLEGLRDTGRLATYLRALRAGRAPLIVVNGGQDGIGLTRRLFESGLGETLGGWIPALPGAAAAASAHALPLAAVAGTGGNGNPFAALATLLTGENPEHRPLARGWWPWRR